MSIRNPTTKVKERPAPETPPDPAKALAEVGATLRDLSEKSQGFTEGVECLRGKLGECTER